MTAAATAVRELHRIHQQLADLQERLERGPRRVKARETSVAQLEAELNQSQEETTAVRMAADQKQLQLKSKEDRIDDLKGKLNSASSNREFQALKGQIAADEMANSVLEDEILEALQKIDTAQARVDEASSKVEKARAEFARLREKVENEGAMLKSELARVTQQLKPAEDALPGDLKELYGRMVRTRGAEGMAPIDGESCSGCYQRMTPNQLNTLMLGTIVVCGGCGRIVYLPEDRSPGAAP